MNTPSAPRSATRLSGLAPRLSGISSRFYGLARLSLLLVALSMLSGCLVEDPPLYTEPTQTTPRLVTRLAKPALDRIIIVDKGDPIEFSMPVVSEDVGEEVQALLFVDSFPFNSDTDTVPPSTLDDLSRSLKLSYQSLPVIDFGCHRMMMRVSHQSNFDFQTSNGTPIDDADVSEAIWWVNVVDIAAGDNGAVLKDCVANAAMSPRASNSP